MEEVIVGDELDLSELERRKRVYLDWLALPEQRDRLLARAQYNEVARNSVPAQYLATNLCQNNEHPAEGCLFFIENFCWTYDPRSEDKNLPVVLFDFQKDAVRYLVDHIDNGRDFLIEKSRDMGISWLVVYVFIWYWLFREGTNLLIGSYKEKLVDDGVNQDALFGKIEYCIRNLPKWILPARFTLKKHRQKLKLINPENNNIISGDTMNPEFGRGARKTAIFYDELGFWETAKDSWDAGSQTTPCRIANSTPHGRNFYWKLRTQKGMDVLTLHWKLHPLKDNQWYEFEKGRNTDEVVAQEIDLSYEKSLEGRVYLEWEPELGFYAYNENYPLYLGCDWGKADGTAMIWAQIIDRKLRIVDAFYKTGETIDFFIPFITGLFPPDDYRYSKKELEKIETHRKWKKAIVYGDPAGSATSSVTNKSVFSIMRDSGIRVICEDRWKTFANRRTATKMRLRNGVELNTNDDTEYLSMCIEQAAYKTYKMNGETYARDAEPNHDWTSHHRSALEYLCLGLEQSKIGVSAVKDKFSRGGKTFNPYVRRQRGAHNL